MKRKKTETVAAIDIGSNLIRMTIAQIIQDGSIIKLDSLKKRTSIGRDTFSHGRIQVSSIHETCDILKGFVKLMRDYSVTTYKAITTSGIREAENGEYVLEQIRLSTKLNIEVINNAQERFYMYKSIRNNLSNKFDGSDYGDLFMHIGSGAAELLVFLNGSLKYVDYIKIGALRLRGLLSTLERRSIDFPNIMEEFIDSRISFLKKRFKALNIKSLICIGGELKVILKIAKRQGFDERIDFIGKDQLNSLYNSIKNMTTEQIMKEYTLDIIDAELLLPSIIVFYKILKITNADRLNLQALTLRDGILVDMSEERFNTPGKAESINDVLSSVWYLADNYSIDVVHSKHVEYLALSIFDQTRKLHKMLDKDRFYLQIACILHDVGKHVNHNQHDIHSYNIIKNQDIMGMSDNETKIIAYIAKYHDEILPNFKHENNELLQYEDRIRVSKLAAILKLAEALDISHKQKIKELNIQIKDREVILNVKSKTDLMLEEWNYEESVDFFYEIIGYKLKLIQG